MGKKFLRKQGGLRSGLMFYADGNTRDGMVDVVSGAPGLIVGTGGSMVVRPESRGWAYAQANQHASGLLFDVPAMRRLMSREAMTIWAWGMTNLNGGVPAVVMGPGVQTVLFMANDDGTVNFAYGAGNPGGNCGLDGTLKQFGMTWKKDGDTRFYGSGVLTDVVAGGNAILLPEVGEWLVIGNYTQTADNNSEANLWLGLAIWNRELRADEMLHLGNDPLALRRACWGKKVIGN